MVRIHLHFIVFGLLTICTQCFAESEEEQRFYELYPDLRAHKEVVQKASEQVKQSGFQAKTSEQVSRAIAVNAYLLLSQSSGAKIPYSHVLDTYNDARSNVPSAKEWTVPELARAMNDGTHSSAFDEGLSDNGLRRVGANVENSFVNSWWVVIVLTVTGLIFLLILFRRTRTPRTGQQDHPRPAPADGGGFEATGLIVDCPSCFVTVRLHGVADVAAVTCPECGDRFEIRITDSGHVHVYQRVSRSPDYARDEDNDPYAVLGVPSTATAEEIKSAFRKRMQEYHPDRVAPLGVRLRALAEEETKRINRAYLQLLDPRSHKIPE
jgi:hypothetical protein